MTLPGADAARAIRRLALLYRHFAETIAGELEPGRAREIILKAISAYGGQIGREARQRAEAKGLPLIPENFSDDLPITGWACHEEDIDGERVTRMDVCPLADEWRGMAPGLAALYCCVDQAKMEAFNPEFTYAHLSKQTDGDPVCRLVARRKDRPL